MLSAILVAAGNSRRVGFDKLFVQIAGLPVIGHTIHPFERADCISEIIVVACKNRHAEIGKITHDLNFRKVRSVVTGGEHRQDSVRAGLACLDADAKYVAVHDGARPLVTLEQIERVFKQCQIHGAASLAEPVSNSLKRVDDDLVVTGSVERHQLYAMQTPQVFERALIEDAYRVIYAENLSVTDEVSAVERLGHKVVVVLNDDFNFKITYLRDLPLAEFILNQRTRCRAN